MISTRRLLREASRCVLAGSSFRSMGRRLAFAPLGLWLTNPRRALLFVGVRPYTMLPYVRLSKLAELADECNQNGVAGAFVQCGVWKGGSGAVLEVAAIEGKRQTWLLDSFDGCPQPGPQDVSMHGRKGAAGLASAPMEDVVGLLFDLGLDPNREDLWICRGWFEKTVPLVAGKLSKIALLHLDADWYESIHRCMDWFYPRVTEGGYVVVDDFGYWQGTQKAVSEYFDARGMPRPKLTWVDHACVYWEKTE